MSKSKQTTKTRATRTSGNVWSDEERAAMQESARERKASSGRDAGDARAEGERDVLAKIT